jgi:hypothetical protein
MAHDDEQVEVDDYQEGFFEYQSIQYSALFVAAGIL